VDLLDDAAGGLADIHTDVGTVTTDVAAVHVHVGTIDGHITADYGATEKTCVDLLDDAAGGLADIHTDVADLHTDLADVHTDVGTAITNIGDVHATDLPALKTVVDDIHNTDLPDLHTDVAAVKTETAAILLVVGTNGVTVANINENAIDYESLKADAVDKILDEIVEGTLTMRHVLKLVLSAIGGKASGGGTATVIFRDNADSKARITLTVDASGNRTASVLDGA
jgi:hypothetical protein